MRMRAACFALLVVLPLSVFNWLRPGPFRGRMVNPPQPVPPLEARDHQGGIFRMADQRGKVVLLYFGYTYCPDACPTTLARWKRVHQQLGEDAKRVRFVFVTVDPERDTPKKVREYLELFSPDFIGLVGSEKELRPFYRFFGAQYEKVPTPGSAAGYLVAHTLEEPVVDTLGRWRLIFNPKMPLEDYVHDLRILLSERRTERR